MVALLVLSKGVERAGVREGTRTVTMLLQETYIYQY